LNTLRGRLIVLFLAATLVPLAVTLWIAASLLDRSLQLSTIQEVDSLSRSVEVSGRALYQRSRELMKSQIAAGSLKPKQRVPADAIGLAEAERFEVKGDRLRLYVRQGSTADLFEMPLGVSLEDLQRQHSEARMLVERASKRDLRRGYLYTLGTLAAAVWVASLVLLIFQAHRVSRPIRELTGGLRELAEGNLDVRLQPERTGEVGLAMQAFNESAEQLKHSQERVVHLAKVASWQTLARKMAHELKNSLTPIRLTMEEIYARRFDNDSAFLEQASQIVTEEVGTLERRVRAFSEFASEPPVEIRPVDVKALLEERISFLKNSHPGVTYDAKLEPDVQALADEDLLKGVLTNLLENAADAAGGGGVVLGKAYRAEGKVAIEVHDSGKGLSPLARSTLFEPTISFKKTGMGLGLSIARRSTVLSGGEIQLVEGELGGAGFRVLLPTAGHREMA
jgi:two-component system, NtrC family, nitrogen regulation sensor histidine kinase NtrY